MELIDNNPPLSVTDSIVPPVAMITWDDIALIMRRQTGVETDAPMWEAMDVRS